MLNAFVFRNYDKSAIKLLLKDIGRNTFEKACEQRQIPVPMNMKGFYLESKKDCTFLMCKFPLATITYMKIDGYNLPLKGWGLMNVRHL